MILIIIAAFLLAIAAYVQWQIENFVLEESRALAMRMVLVLLGIAVGIVFARASAALATYTSAPIFFIGFGLVHVPAAAILFLKRQRGEGRT